MKKTMILVSFAALSLALSGTALAEESTAPADILVQNASDYVTMPDFSELELYLYTSAVTEDDVVSELDALRYDLAEEEEVTTGAEDDDLITMDLSYSVDGEETTEEDIELYQGYEFYGTEFDEALYGAVAGDVLDFDVDFAEDEEYIDEEWLGQTVSFHVEISSVTRTVLPEITDEYVRENLGYDSVDAYKEVLLQQLQEDADFDNEQTSIYQAVESALDESTFTGYPEELFDSVLEDTKEMYASIGSMYGVEEETELFELFGITDEDLQSEALYSVNRRILISAVIQQEELTFTEAELEAAAEKLYSYYEYDNVEDFKEAYGDELAYIAAEQVVGEYLLETGHVEETELDSDDYDDYDYEDETDYELFEGLTDDWFEIETEEE